VIRGIPYCPIEVAVVLWAISIGSVLAGAAVMFVFGIGTTIGLIPLGFVMGGIAQKAKKTKYEKYVPTICGSAFIIFGIVLIVMHILGIAHGH
jgi:sulfite exporter TauE/SafE